MQDFTNAQKVCKSFKDTACVTRVSKAFYQGLIPLIGWYSNVPAFGFTSVIL